MSYMDISSILASIDSEIERLQQARSILSGLPNTESKRGPGRPRGVVEPKATTRKKRVLSEDARARIAAAQKKRWAAKGEAK